MDTVKSNLGELEKNVKFDADDLNTAYVPNKTITVRTNSKTKNLPQSLMVNFLVTSFAYIEGQHYRITQYCYENSENLSYEMYVRRGISNTGESSIIWSAWQRVLLNGDIIDNLTSTDTNKLLSANQGKILNDTKLNKTDANKLNCVSFDYVSLKEYILTNFTETGKTYYLIAKTTCTDLPKASNFYITVETPGMYTYKVTAKELNDSNGIYVCTYRTLSSSWTEWEKVLISGDITTTISDSSTDTQVPSAKAVYDELQEVFQSVCNGKNLIASAITDKGVDTLADATFEQMADYIEKISGGSETIPTSYNKGTIDCGKIKDIILDISKTYFVTTAVKFTETNHTNRVANFFITNGVLNTIINTGEATSSCSLTGDKLTISNTNSIYSIDYTVLQM